MKIGRGKKYILVNSGFRIFVDSQQADLALENTFTYPFSSYGHWPICKTPKKYYLLSTSNIRKNLILQSLELLYE